MTRKRKNTEPAAIKRKRAARLSDEDCARFLPAMEELLHRLRRKEKPPPYLYNALERFIRKENERIDRIAAHNMVIRAADEGFPLTRGHSSVTPSAFEVVAKKIGESSAWVEDAYLNPKK